jgi:undecaprenyl-diphosphatase
VLFVSLLLLVFVLLWTSFYATGPAIERLLKRVAHRAAAFRYSDYLPVFLVVAAGLSVSLLAGHAFEELAEAVQENSPRLQSFDRIVHDTAALARSDGSTRLFVTMTWIGTPVVIGILVALVTLLLASKGRWRWAVYLALTNGVGALINLALKTIFARARPDLAAALRQAHGYSFPSGHAMGATIFFGTVTYLMVRSSRGWQAHAFAMAFGCTMAIAISASRVYLGVHWISDVAAGYSSGLLWLVTSTVAYETFRRIRRVRARRATAAR